MSPARLTSFHDHTNLPVLRTYSVCTSDFSSDLSSGRRPMSKRNAFSDTPLLVYTALRNYVLRVTRYASVNYKLKSNKRCIKPYFSQKRGTYSEHDTPTCLPARLPACATGHAMAHTSWRGDTCWPRRDRPTGLHVRLSKAFEACVF
jgi:hypothetical protein